VSRTLKPSEVGWLKSSWVGRNSAGPRKTTRVPSGLKRSKPDRRNGGWLASTGALQDGLAVRFAE
jgi:hypothetical protein